MFRNVMDQKAGCSDLEAMRKSIDQSNLEGKDRCTLKDLEAHA